MTDRVDFSGNHHGLAEAQEHHIGRTVQFRYNVAHHIVPAPDPDNPMWVTITGLIIQVTSGGRGYEIYSANNPFQGAYWRVPFDQILGELVDVPTLKPLEEN